jgi:hypothetical protein
MNTKITGGLVRHILAAFCVAALMHALDVGQISGAQLQAVLAHWQEILEAGGFLGAVGWSILSKRDPKVAQEVADAAASLGVDANSLEDLHQVLLKAATTNDALASAKPLPTQASQKPAVVPSAIGGGTAVLLLFTCGLCALAVTQSACTTTAAGSSQAQIIQANTQAAVTDLLIAEPGWRTDVTAMDNALLKAELAQEFASAPIMAEVGSVVSPTSKAYGVINDIVAKSAPDLVAVEAGVSAALKATAPPVVAPVAAPKAN